jgi:hypothetical protein
MSIAHVGILVGAGLLGGATAAMAGGAALLTFPILLAIGLAPLQANVTNSIGLTPASVSAALSSGPELAGQRSGVWPLAIPAIAGAAVGRGGAAGRATGCLRGDRPVLQSRHWSRRTMN